MKIAVVLYPSGFGDSVRLDGVEIGHALRGLEVLARAGEPTVVRLDLLAEVEVSGDVERVLLSKTIEREHV